MKKLVYFICHVAPNRDNGRASPMGKETPQESG